MDMAKFHPKLAANLNLRLRDPASVIVYMFLLAERPEGRTQVAASLQTIVDGTGLSKSTVQRSVEYLVEHGAVRKKVIETSVPIYTLVSLSGF